MRLAHLARRFVRALRPGGPSADDVTWVESVLEPAELALWRQLPNHDRRYSIRVARRTQDLLSGTDYAGDPRWLAVALLHDVGKLDAGLGIAGRVVATAAGVAIPRVRTSESRIGRYLRHDELGAARIRAAGGRAEAARWALAHHHRDRWAASSVPETVARALEAADNS